MNKIFEQLYSTNLLCATIIILMTLFVWSIISYLFSKYNKAKIFKIINCVIFILAVVFIVFLCLVGRIKKERILNLNPLNLFYLAKIEPEMYRSMLMNVFLFVPFGMTLPFALDKGKINISILLSCIIGLLFSIFIELSQYIFCIGEAETIDIICNLLGTIIGATPFILTNNLLTKNDKSSEK